jgi:hypothetical protein
MEGRSWDVSSSTKRRLPAFAGFAFCFYIDEYCIT